MAKNNKTSAADELAESYGEMLALLQTHYERTGDLALKEVVDRARARRDAPRS